jgi:hypoxanthine phosphoribosyltransferase
VTGGAAPGGLVASDPRLGGRALRRVVFDELAIARRVRELGAEITDSYPDGDLLVLGLLKGSVIFFSDVVRTILRPLQIDFLIASSYGSGKESSGVVRLVYDPDTTLRDRHVLVVEDIVDSGRTLARLLGVLRQGQPRSLAVCALLHKRLPTALQEPVRFVGFDAPHEFLVGYGLDHAEDFRHLPYIGAI